MNICKWFTRKKEEVKPGCPAVRKFVENICKELEMGEFKHISIYTSGIALNRNDNITICFYETPLLSLYINGIKIDISYYERFTLRAALGYFYDAQTALKNIEAFEEKEQILKEIEGWSFDEKGYFDPSDPVKLEKDEKWIKESMQGGFKEMIDIMDRDIKDSAEIENMKKAEELKQVTAAVTRQGIKFSKEIEQEQ